jgi:hypothetical protein
MDEIVTKANLIIRKFIKIIKKNIQADKQRNSYKNLISLNAMQ